MPTTTFPTPQGSQEPLHSPGSKGLLDQNDGVDGMGSVALKDGADEDEYFGMIYVSLRFVDKILFDNRKVLHPMWLFFALSSMPLVIPSTQLKVYRPQPWMSPLRSASQEMGASIPSCKGLQV